MTFDEYNQKITQIHTELQNIADKTANQALAGCADSSNPAFIELMQKHEQLTKLSSVLTERMISQMGGRS